MSTQLKGKTMAKKQEQLYVVFTIVCEICDYIEFNLLTADEAKQAALNLLDEWFNDDPIHDPKHPQYKEFIETELEEYKRRKEAIMQLSGVDLNDEVDLLIVPVARRKIYHK